VVVIAMTFVPIILAERLTRGAGLIPRAVEEITPEADTEPMLEPEPAL
jgi:hypothetical protein